MRECKINVKIIIKTEINVKNSMILWRDLKLLVSPSDPLFGDHTIYQMRNIICD